MTVPVLRVCADLCVLAFAFINGPSAFRRGSLFCFFF